MEKPKATDALSYAMDPVDGTMLGAVAGEQAQCDFSFYNMSPDPASFYLVVQGLSTWWAQGVGEDLGTMVAASGSGVLRLKLTPDVSATEGDYTFDVTIMCDGSPFSIHHLLLRVEPGRVPKPAPVLRTEPPVVAPLSSVPTAEAVVNVAPANSYPAAATWPLETPPERPPFSPPAALADRHESPPLPDLPVVTAPISPPAPTPRPIPRIVDLGPPPVEAEARPTEAEPTEPETVEPSLQDPPSGTILPVRPGETLLLRFGFKSEQAGNVTFILDHDGYLTPEWLTLIQDQVNLARGVSGDVSLRLTPPLGAEPGEYPFTVTLGPLGGARTPRPLILSVSATPAVRLTVKEPSVKIGPLAHTADFQLTVATDGNADTAFRVAAKAPQVSEAETAGMPLEIYETSQWRYLFDKEMADLRSPAAGQPPQPVPIRLRLVRKGIWWLGWTERHMVLVGATPVTDTANGAKRGNTVEVIALRWRLLPFPAILLVPILLLLFLTLAGSPDNLRVEGSETFNDDANTVYVFGENLQQGEKDTQIVVPDNIKKPAMTVPIVVKWDPPLVRAVDFRIGSGESQTRFSSEYTDPVHVTDKDYIKDVSYSVAPKFRAGGPPAMKVFVIPARTANKLQITDGSGAPLAETKTEPSPVGKGRTRVTECTVQLIVPRNGQPVNVRLKDLHPGYQVDMILVHKPTSAFRIGDIIDSRFPVPESQQRHFTVAFTGKPDDADATGQEVTWVSTDAGHQILHIKLAVQ